MPQYKRTKYGLKQYGTFLPIDKPEGSKRYRFIRARFGIRKKDGVFWLYQHEAVTVNGSAGRLRLKTNTGETIQEELIQVKGEYSIVRLSTPKGNSLLSQQMRM